ncbi:lysozyme [Mesorhizobium sp. Cs1299R1N3]|uniref:lysozyme n=1 Tax=Mesorhizobium sp. Cs1299R1N3 TaxID=3015173 RepID=UPI00301C7FB3
MKSRYLQSGAAGLALLAAATAYTGSWEGEKFRPYYDVGHVLTVCRGHTGPDIIKDKLYTPAECDAITAKDIIAHEQRLLACAPELWTVPGATYNALNDWAFNVGTGAACKSTLIKKVKAGNLRDACLQLSKWVFVNDEVIKGLMNRRVTGTPGRESEQAMCLRGLREGK